MYMMSSAMQALPVAVIKLWKHGAGLDLRQQD
jgi:hypothetical protein